MGKRAATTPARVGVSDEIESKLINRSSTRTAKSIFLETQKGIQNLQEKHHPNFEPSAPRIPKQTRRIDWKILIFGGLILLILGAYIFAPRESTAPLQVTLPSSDFVRARVSILEQELGRSDPTIYLIWTTPIETFRLRNYRVLDSYLFHHPSAHIIIYSTHLTADAFSKYTIAGYKVTIVNATDSALRELASECPGQNWINQIDHWRAKSPYFYSHITDFIRFCALYRWGGIYSDFDALQLKKLHSLGQTFIGKDSSGAKVSCEWCLPGGDAYLAPGVMGSKKGHPLVFQAMKVAFDGHYDPNVFNGVGPMAVTKAYQQLGIHDREDVKVLPQHTLYPYSYLTSWKAFKRNENGDAVALTEKLVQHSVSLHLYGHMTKKLKIEDDSILSTVVNKFWVVKDPIHTSADDVAVILTTPTFFSAPNHVDGLVGVRIVSANYIGEPVGITLTPHHGRVRVVGEKDHGEWTNHLHIVESSMALMNAKLAKVVYDGTGVGSGVDMINIKLTQTDSSKKNQLLESRDVPVYNVNKDVTIMIKTMDRMTKVFLLIESILERYPNITIIASDDGDHAMSQKEGHKRGFYYLPLPRDIGLSAGRNMMVDRVTTKYVLTLDDDFIFDSGANLEALVHALETPDSTGKHFDIAAAKNPADEERFDLDFCGIMQVTSKRTLSLGPGSRGRHANCHHVDFVPNIFLARTNLLKHQLRWDELLKLGEHEDFFLRAQSIGVRTLTCPQVSFYHDQVPHWKVRTDYDRKRNRVYDFLKLSLRKHNLNKMVSFGRTMMDLVVPPQVENFKATEVLARTVTLYWVSSAFSFKVLQSSDDGNSWGPVNYGQGEAYEPVPQIPTDDPEGPSRPEHAWNMLVVFGLEPDTKYLFRIFAGNRFSFEERGRNLEIKTLSIDAERSINLVQNPAFSSNTQYYDVSQITSFELVYDPATKDPSARTQITTVGYMYNFESFAAITQAVPGHVVNKALAAIANSKKKTISFSVRSKLDRIFDKHPSWRAELRVWLGSRKKQDICAPAEQPITDNTGPSSWHGSFADLIKPRVVPLGKVDPRLSRQPDILERVEFDRSVERVWQSRVISVCLSEQASVELIEVGGVLFTFRGSVVWDDFSLVVGVSNFD